MCSYLNSGIDPMIFLAVNFPVCLVVHLCCWSTFTLVFMIVLLQSSFKWNVALPDQKITPVLTVDSLQLMAVKIFWQQFTS